LVEKLSAEERDQALRSLPGWRLADGRDAIAKTYRFRVLSAGFGVLARWALVAEKMEHHP
jgi:4a-hydroxytetrahydrobiopterin dehydratase